MATLCSHCGGELPRDDAHFCNNCGTMWPARPSNSPSSAGTDNNLSPGVMLPEDAQPVPQVLTGQASPQPPVRIKQRPDIDQMPGWMRGAHRESGDTQAPKDKNQHLIASQEQAVKPQDALVKNEQQERPIQQPEPAIHTTVMERSVQSQDATGSEQLDFPVLPSTPQSFSPVRELRVKVWSEADPLHSQPGLNEAPVQQEDAKFPFLKNKQPMEVGTQKGHAVEDQPTRLMESIPQASQASMPVDDIPTNPLFALPGEQLQTAPEQSVYSQSHQKPGQVPSDVTDVSHMSTVHLQAQQQSQASPLPSVLSRDDHPVAPTNRPVFTSRTRKRLPLIVGSTAVLLLLVLALGSWIILSQPFRVSPVTDTQQSFTDAKLGVSLRYPNGWQTPQVDYGKQIITLRDGSDTAQMDIRIVNASTESPESYLQKQAVQLGINNPRSGSSSSFADSSWQGIQGDGQVKGAEYTYGLFATVHKNHFYTLAQLAPRSTYADEEKLIFAPTRLSLHFL